MHQFVKDHYDSIWGYGVETDDMVARYWKQISDDIGRDEVMIVSIDKDYKQFPCLMYNYHYKHQVMYWIYQKKKLCTISMSNALLVILLIMCNYFKGKGKVFAGKYLKDCDNKIPIHKKAI